MNRLAASFAALPRSARWAVLALIAFSAYFLVIEPILDHTNRRQAAADSIESSLRRASLLADADSDDGRLVANGTKAYGRPNLPDSAAARPEAIQRVVDQVLGNHSVENRSKTERNSTLTGDRARAYSADGKIERYIVEVSFEAPQEAVAAVIAELEQAPGISAVSRVKIDRTAIRGSFDDFAAPGESPAAATVGRVRATISAESWVLVKPRPGAGPAGDTTSGGDPS